MTSAGRWIGHAMGIFFIVMGVAFVVIGMSNDVVNTLAGVDACSGGECEHASARTTMLILGWSFIASGAITMVITEWSVRKVRGVMSRATAFNTSAASPQGLGDLLQEFGISIDPAANANVTVNRQTIDLRGQRGSSEVPTDPAGLSNYLKSFGINIDEGLLRNATVVHGGETVTTAGAFPGSAAVPVPPPAASTSELRRERATIVRKKDRGSTAGDQRLIEFELELTPAGKPPYRVQVASLVRSSLAPLLVEGSSLNVRVDPADENNVTIDWSEN